MLRSLIWGRSCNFTGISFLFSIGQGGSVRVRLLVPAAPQRHGVVRVGRSVGLPRRILRRRRGRRSLWPVPPLLGLATGLLALAFLINFMNFISLILHQSKLLISTQLKVFLAYKTCFYRQKKLVKIWNYPFINNTQGSCHCPIVKSVMLKYCRLIFLDFQSWLYWVFLFVLLGF